jgi:hypothetical protein
MAQPVSQPAVYANGLMSYVGLLPSAGWKEVSMTTQYEAPFHITIQSMYINKEQPISVVWKITVYCEHYVKY